MSSDEREPEGERDGRAGLITPVGLVTVAREWGRIGCIGFGGPPTHIKLLRELCVEQRGWITPGEFEDANAACNLLPGPASTQMSIFCAWKVRGRPGAIVGGLAFILPGMISIIALAALFLASSPPRWVIGAGAGAGAAVAAVALNAGWDLLTASWKRKRHAIRWTLYLIAAGVATATIGPWLVLVLLGCGLAELAIQHPTPPSRSDAGSASPTLLGIGTGTIGTGTVAAGGLGALAWVAIKIGLLSYGGGFVIIPLMQSDAVNHYHWLSADQFLNAVALGQITPGPVVHTMTAVGYAAAGIGGALFAGALAFSPSFAFILLGAAHFDRLRGNPRVRAFLDGAGPAAIGAIIGSAIPLARALAEGWQFAVLAGAAVLLLALHRGVVTTLLAAGAVGVIIALAGGPLPH